jgi:UTP--glucose-1-phosphate uridylyltransferase
LTLELRLLPIGTLPTLHMVIEEAASSGIERIVLVSSPQKRLIEEYFEKNTSYEKALSEKKKQHLLDEQRKLSDRVEIVSVMQDDPKGLGHAILCAKDAVGDEPFVIILPDVLIESETPCCKQLVDAYAKTGCSVNATEHTPREQIHLYGIYDIGRSDGNYHWANGVVEKPSAEAAPSDFSVVGRYLFTSDVFTILENTPPGKGGEIQLADAMNTLAGEERMVAYEYEGHQYDTGDELGFIKANIHYGLKKYPDELKRFIREV